jgi:hypothetical protein
LEIAITRPIWIAPLRSYAVALFRLATPSFFACGSMVLADLLCTLFRA